MNIELILALIAFFLAALAFVIVIGTSLRVHRLEREMDLLRFNMPDYNEKDVPTFLRRQAD